MCYVLGSDNEMNRYFTITNVITLTSIVISYPILNFLARAQEFEVISHGTHSEIAVNQQVKYEAIRFNAHFTALYSNNHIRLHARADRINKIASYSVGST